jgi:hypothetical protein
MTGHQASRPATWICLRLDLARDQRALIRAPAPGITFEQRRPCSPSRAPRIMPSSRPPQPQLTSTFTPALGILSGTQHKTVHAAHRRTRLKQALRAASSPHAPANRCDPIPWRPVAEEGLPVRSPYGVQLVLQ